MPQPQAELFDLYRTGLKSAADLMKASLESAERLQNQQLVAIRRVIDDQSKSVLELSRAKTLDELLSVQTRIAGQQFENAVSLWSDFWANATRPLVAKAAEESKRAKA